MVNEGQIHKAIYCHIRSHSNPQKSHSLRAEMCSLRSCHSLKFRTKKRQHGDMNANMEPTTRRKLYLALNSFVIKREYSGKYWHSPHLQVIVNFKINNK